MNTDLQPLRPYIDHHTWTVISQATRQLGFLRGYRGPYLDDPTARLGLLASLQHQLRTEIINTTCHAHQLGYTINDILTLLTIEETAPR
jgi:hypothetical protein